MANKWHCGAENNTATAGHEWDLVSGTGLTIGPSSNYGHGLGSLGQYAWRFLRSTAASVYNQHQFAASANAGIFYYGFSLSVVTAVAALCKVFVITQAITDVVSVRLDTDNTLKIYRDDTNVQIGSTSAPLTVGQVYWISLMYDSTLGVGTVTVKLDDVQFSTGTAANNQSQYRVKWGLITSTTGEIWIDDIFVNTSAGSFNNTYPPSNQYLIAARPNAAGDVNNAFAGTYLDVDEQVPDDVTTILDIRTDNDIVDVNIDDVATLYSLAAATDTIPFVAVWIRETSQSTSANGWNARIKSQGSGTVGAGPTVTHNDTAYKTNGDTPPLLPYVSETDPQDGGVWVVGDLANTQIGIQVTDAAPDTYVTQMWAYVCVKRTSEVVKDIINGLGIIPFARA
jgi:hypothetical protein